MKFLTKVKLNTKVIIDNLPSQEELADLSKMESWYVIEKLKTVIGIGSTIMDATVTEIKGDDINISIEGGFSTLYLVNGEFYLDAPIIQSKQG